MHCQIAVPPAINYNVSYKEPNKIFPRLNAPSVRFDIFVNKVKHRDVFNVKLQSSNKYLDFSECNGSNGRVYLPLNYNIIELLIDNTVYIDVIDSIQHPRIFDVFLTIMQILIIQQLTKNKNDIINSFVSNILSIDGIIHTSDIISIISSSDSDIKQLFRHMRRIRSRLIICYRKRYKK